MGQQVEGLTTIEGDLGALSDLLASGMAADCKVGLYLAEYAPSRANKLADIQAHQPTFAGYAPAPAAFSAAGLDQNGTARSISVNVMFEADDADTPENIGGAYLYQESAGPPVLARLMAWYPFAIPITVGQAMQSIGVKVVVTAPDLSGYAMIEG